MRNGGLKLGITNATVQFADKCFPIHGARHNFIVIAKETFERPCYSLSLLFRHLFGGLFSSSHACFLVSAKSLCNCRPRSSQLCHCDENLWPHCCACFACTSHHFFQIKSRRFVLSASLPPYFNLPSVPFPLCNLLLRSCQSCKIYTHKHVL